MRKVVLGFVSVLVVAVLVIGGYFFALFDPFRWGVVQSTTFTWEKFATVKKGEQIGAVVARLGKPVRRPYEFKVITADPSDPCFNGGCKEYIFAGANWGASYKEAIVIADRNGRVVLAKARQE